MSPTFNRRAFLRGACVIALPVLATPAGAHEYFTTCLTVIHPWTRASESGATSALVSMRFTDVRESDRLVGAQTSVAASAMLTSADGRAVTGFDIPAGRDSEMVPEGVHLRLIGLKHALLLGREYPMTLVFEKTGPLQAALLIDFGPET